MFIRKKLSKFFCTTFIATGLFIGAQNVRAEEDNSEPKRIAQLEKMINSLMKEVQTLKANQSKKVEVRVAGNDGENSGKTVCLTVEEVNRLKKLASERAEGKFDKLLDSDSWLNKFTLGGYGDMHANFGEGKDKDTFDHHRLVLYTGYEFADWLKFNAEIELEHGFVKDGQGEIALEQGYVDAYLGDGFNLRLGRVLAPLGIINQTHEPTTFNGTERPLFAKYMIPTTWSVDGIGAFGQISDRLSYQAYVVGSLDGSKIDKNGIRSGRIKSRPSLHSPAFTGRLDYQAIRATENDNEKLRLGVSTFIGGLNNADKGGVSNVHGEVMIFSGDYQYTNGSWDLRGVVAHTQVSDAESIGNNAASESFGWYQEVAYRWMPDSWKKGKLVNSDSNVFVRYDWVDTQYDLPTGVEEIGSGRRDEWTIGMNWWLTPQFVLKMDYQFRNDKSKSDLNDSFNLGAGFTF